MHQLRTRPQHFLAIQRHPTAEGTRAHTMSIPTMPTYKHNYYLFHMRDIPNPQRDKHLEAHVQHTQLFQNGPHIRFGGALLPQTKTTSEADVLKDCVGSFFFVQTDTLEEAWDIIKRDPFYASGEVWDRETVTGAPVHIVIPEVKFD
ncbi:hypothetical protein FKP32DRAFT_1022701 [Trametes sanguinea]|nr:hypothetical protein FKP32DRAFT_1022701 [Trametes sanguinea]